MHHHVVDQIVQDRMSERQRILGRHHRAELPPAPPARTGDLAVDLATLGFEAVEHEIARLARDARRCGVIPVLVDVLVDRQQPDVARQRAFLRIATSLEWRAPCRAAAA